MGAVVNDIPLGVSAERWLAITGFADSRVHSSVEIAILLEEFAAYRMTEIETLLPGLLQRIQKLEKAPEFLRDGEK